MNRALFMTFVCVKQARFLFYSIRLTLSFLYFSSLLVKIEVPGGEGSPSPALAFYVP